MKRYTLVTIAALAIMASAVAPAGAQSRGKAHTFSFSARVVKSSSRGLQVRTSDGRLLSFSASQIRRPSQHKPAKPACRKHKKHTKCSPKRHRGAQGHVAQGTTTPSGTITINIQGLQPGVTIVITETVDADGNVTITITLPPPSSEQSASGVVSDVQDDAFTIEAADGSVMRFHMAPDALSALHLDSCNTVDVSYHQDAGVLIANKVNVTGTSSSGDCTPTEDAQGTITSVSGSALTISTEHGSLKLAVGDPSLTDGFQTGDLVDVTYTQAADGTLNATNVQYVEQTASGTATKVSPSSMTISPDDGSASLTFAAGKGMQVQSDSFDGVHQGDHVNVSYHVSSGKLVADCVQVGPAPSDQSGTDSSGDGSSGGSDSAN